MEAKPQTLTQAVRYFADEDRAFEADKALRWPHYIHHCISHAEEYGRGQIHTNNIEDFWSLLRRSINGACVSVDPVPMQRYIGDRPFRFKERKGNGYGPFAGVVFPSS